ncbi:MAG: hypothetical protein GXP31_05885 [Kiritimatiellaeota bacterium]|nr:hypothetical protein [Kiritimatiellota bacterium]
MPDGRFLGTVDSVGTTRFNRAGAQAAAYSNIAVASTPGGRRVYMMDLVQGRIRVLERIEPRCPVLPGRHVRTFCTGES